MEKLTLQQAATKVKEIGSVTEGRGKSHAMEDTLRNHFLLCLVGGYYTEMEAIQIANEILKTNNMVFSRRYA